MEISKDGRLEGADLYIRAIGTVVMMGPGERIPHGP